MLYLGCKDAGHGLIDASYGMLNSKGMERDFLSTVIDAMGKDITVVLTRRRGDEEIDVTEELECAGWKVYNCPAFKEDFYVCDVFRESQDVEDSLIVTILSTDFGVQLIITGVADEDRDPRIPPFCNFVNTVENMAHHLKGIRDGIAVYRLTFIGVGLKEELEAIEGNDIIQFGLGDLYQSMDINK